MGVFTVGRQVALEIDMPGWWLANAAVDMDFRRGLYYDSSTANPRAATDFLSCTRASVGYAKTTAGTLTSFASNALRITDAGLLVEDARTNIIRSSQAIGNADWLNTAITVTADGTVAPDGTTTADTFTEDATFENHQSVEIWHPTVTAGSTVTASCYGKQSVGSRYLAVDLSDNITGEIVGVLDLSTGVITNAGFGVGEWSNVVLSSEALGNGWWRAIVTGKLGATRTLTALKIVMANSTSGGQYTGNGTSAIAVWGAQIEVGSFASSYIPTTGAAATRAAENITTSGSLQTAINTATGSLVAQTDNGGGSGFAANIVDSNGTNLLGFNASNNALASMIGTLATGNTANRTTQDKLGLAWNASGRSLVLNGGTVATDASAQTPSATQHIGSTGTTNFAYAYVERLSAWTTKLADATLQGFTV